MMQLNLQFFADQGGGGEKTESATPRKKEKAREEGQVAKSVEVTTTFLLVAMFASLKWIGPSTIAMMHELFISVTALFEVQEIDNIFMAQILTYSGGVLLRAIMPYLLISFAVAFISNALQVGWKPTGKPLMPKLSNLSPIAGFKRMFSLKTIVELIKSIIKIIIIVMIAYFAVRDYEFLILNFYSIPVLRAYALIVNIAVDMGIRIGAFFLIVAVIDYIYQRYSLSKKLKMSKQEVKDEYKMTEGNPEIKQRIRQRMREASMRRMMQDLPKADVIITNPTHFAVAIVYDNHDVKAPMVIAKGADIIAARIREKAKEYKIEIVENKPLARTLYYTVEIGEEIPPELYQTVAEVLAFVYQLKNREKEGAKA